MRIFFERSGGFAGLTFTTAVDITELSQAEAEELRRLLHDADFFNLPSKILSPQPQPDRFQYKLKVEKEGRQYTVNVSDEAMPAKLKPLVKWLIARV